MALRFEVLGFAGAAPLQGACPSYLVSDGEATLLLDCGSGTLERLWRRGMHTRLDAIVVSHMHADHVLDLVLFAGELMRELLGGRRVALYVPRGDGPDVLRRLDAVFAREPSSTTRFQSTFDVLEYDASTSVAVGALTLTFAASNHQQPCFAARVSDGEAAIVYGADGGPSSAVQALATAAELLVLEATHLSDEAAASAQRHMTAAQAGRLAREAGASALLLTHTIAGTPEDGLVANAAAAFGGPVELAREGYVFESGMGRSAADAGL